MAELLSVKPPEELRANLVSLRDPSAVPQAAPTERQLDRDAIFYAFASQMGYPETREFALRGDEYNLRAQTAFSVQAGLTNTIEQNIEEEDFDERLFGIMSEIRQVEQMRRFIPESMVQAIKSGITGSREMAIDRIAKLSHTADRIQERVQSMEGVIPTVVDFAEILLDPLSLVYNQTYKDLTRRYEALLAPTVSPEEFEQGLDQILTEAQDAGFFSSENQFFFGQFLTTLQYGTESGAVQAEDILGALDIASTVGGAVASSLRGVRGLSALRGTTALSAAADLDAAVDPLSAVGKMPLTTRTQEVVDDTLIQAVTIDNPTQTATNIARHSQASISTPTTLRAGLWSSPVHDSIRRFELNSRVLDEMKGYANAVGQAIDEDALKAFANRFVADRLAHLKATGVTRIIDTDIGLDQLDNLFVSDVLGTTKGSYFKTERAAQAAANLGDDVVQVSEGQFAVVRRTNFSADNLRQLKDLGYTGDIEGMMLYKATNPDNLGSGFWARYGSPGAQADRGTADLIFSAESVMQKALRESARTVAKLEKGMKARQVAEVYRVFDHMASLPQREAFTDEQFTRWFNETYKREPTPQQVRYYLHQQELLDAELFALADQMYKRAVQLEASILKLGDVEYTVKPVTRDNIVIQGREQGVEVQVYDFDNRIRVNAIDLEDNVVIYRNLSNHSLPGEVQYVVYRNPEQRAVRHSDFMPRNSGGHVRYVTNGIQFMVKQRTTQTFADGSKRELNPNTLLGARTREEADIAVREINSIIDEINKVESPTKYRSAEDYVDFVSTLSQNRDLDAVLQANKRFNPKIEDFDDFIQFVRDRGLDLRNRFSIVKEGEPLEGFAKLDDTLFALPRMTHSDEVQMNIMRGGRGSQRLLTFGGETAEKLDAQEVLQTSRISTLGIVTETSARIRAGQGLIKAALQSGVMKDGYKEIASLPLRTQLQRIKELGLIDTSGATGADRLVGKKLQLDLERQLFRMQDDSITRKSWDKITRTIGNTMYGMGWKRGANWIDRRSNDPVSVMRGWAFDAYLGMFNPSQLIMQSMQAINIGAIGGTNGLLGVAMSGGMRVALNNGNPNVIRAIGKVFKPITGLSEEEFAVAVEMFKRSGRDVVLNNVAELTLAEDAATMISRTGIGKGVRKVREAGRVFYREGDLIARTAAFNTAFLNYTKKFGKITDPADIKANRWITWEQQRLTQFMTAQSRQGYEQLPFMQFMTYALRINEAIFAGTFGGKAVLTPVEKLRLGIVHLSLFGATASTLSSVVADYVMANTDIEMDENVQRLVHRGAIDAILSWMSGEDTASSARFASSGMAYDVLRSLAEDDILTFFIGPSGEFTRNAVTSLYGTLYNGFRGIAHNDYTAAEDDLVDLARLTSTGNYAYNALTALHFGRYLSRKGALVTDDLTAMDAAFLAFGIPLEETEAAYSYLGMRRIRNGWLDVYADGVSKNYQRMYEAIRRGEDERAAYYLNQIALQMNALEPYDREVVDRQVRDGVSSLIDSLGRELFLRGVETQELVQ